jgi:hypothetical protein
MTLKAQIDPWMAIGLNAAYAVLTGLTVPVVDALGFPGHDVQVVAWAGIAAVPLNMILHAFSSSEPGPAAPADTPAVQAATVVANLPVDAKPSQIAAAKSVATQAIADQKPFSILLLALIFSAALCAAPNFARADSTDLINGLKAHPLKLPIPIGAPATGAAPTVPALTGNPITDLANLNKQIVTQVSNQLEVIANLFAGDANDAMNAALSQPDIQDGNGYSCWKAASAFTTVYKAHPAALTGELMSDLEYQRLMFKAASNLCASPACQQVFGESIAQVAKFASAVPGGAVVGTQNPFTLACSFITTVAIVAPPAGATPSPTPTTTPTPAATPSPVSSPTPSPTPTGG